MPAKIPATVVTGFLGSGKTTLIRHLMENARGRRIALVINEFGDLGVDGGILSGCGVEGCAEDEVIELSNGCICCAVADDFVPAMEAILARDPLPDHIVIETSGLALPQPLVRAFGWPAVRARVTVDGVVALVDGPALAAGRFAQDEAAVERQRAADDRVDHASALAELFEDQLASADMAILGKADLMAPEAVERLTADLRARVRPGVAVRAASHGAVPPMVLLGQGVGAEDDLAARAEVHHHHHDDDHEDEDHHHDDHGHDAFENFVVDLPQIDDPEALAARVGEAIAAHDLLRVKGFAAVRAKPMRLVLQAVGPRVVTHYDRRWREGEARATRLVVIAGAGVDRRAVEATLAAEAATAP
jgi:cobalamin biosynthesis protein CobW